MVIEFDDARGFNRIDRRADISAARADNAVMERGERLIHGAVVAVMVDEDFWALRDFAGDANREAVSIGGGERELPVRKTEAALEFFADPE
jgi:hypothetical protein